MGFVVKSVRFANRAVDLLAELSVVSLVALTLIVLAGVVMRYVFNAPLTWSDEIASYAELMLVFFGLAHTMRINGHIRIDFLTTRLKPRTAQYVQLAAFVIGVFFALIFLLGCWARFENFWIRETISRTVLRTPLYLPALAMLIGSAAFLLILSTRTLQQLAVIFLPDAAERHGLEDPSLPERRP